MSENKEILEWARRRALNVGKLRCLDCDRDNLDPRARFHQCVDGKMNTADGVASGRLVKIEAIAGNCR